MKILLSFIILISYFSFSSYAQIIGDDAIQKVQDGQVSFLDGEFIVFLDDTVSPIFIEQRFSELKYKITFLDIKPIVISIVNSPKDSILFEIENHPSVHRMFSATANIDSTYFKEILEERGLKGDEFEAAFSRIIESQRKEEQFIEFKYSVNETLLKKIMATFRSVAYQIHQNYPRSVNVSCEPGSEQEVMGQIQKLPFVESTALIGIIDDF